MSNDEILTLIGGEDAVRDYLRGVEPGSELDRDAQRNMLAAISMVRAGGVHDGMAQLEPELYGAACLAYCGMMTDGDNRADDERTAAMMIRMLRTDSRNDTIEEE